MLRCATNSLCSAEATHTDPHSPGRIEPQEVVWRASFFPLHFDAADNLLPNFITIDDVENGEISVWRRDHMAPNDIATLKAHAVAGGPQKSKFTAVHGMTADRLRRLEHPVYGRWLCVLDNTVTRTGNDPAHAVIALCGHYPRKDHDIEWAQNTLTRELELAILLT